MPDLTIKPNVGNGNKVIIQDQAGAAVLTTADSGAILGNSTQDNITRLGTVTTGTMKNTIHTDATFPIGHIIKSEMTKVTIAAAIGNTNESDMPAPLDGTMNFTPLQSAPHLLVHMQFNTTAQANTWSSEIIKAYYKVGTGGSWVQYGMSGMTRYVEGHWTSSQHNALFQTMGRASSGISMGSETVIYFKFTSENDNNGGYFRPNSYEIASGSSAVTLSSTDIGNFGCFILVQELKV